MVAPPFLSARLFVAAYTLLSIIGRYGSAICSMAERGSF
jgi:hypothetical protein